MSTNVIINDLKVKNTGGFFKNNNRNDGEHPIRFSGSTLDWYKLTEISSYVLSQVVSESIHQQLEELVKLSPDQERIYELEQIALKAAKLSMHATNFKSKERMLKLVSNYSNFSF